MTRLRLLMVTPRFEPSVGGVETHVREVGRRLVARGHEVTVIAMDAGEGLQAAALAHGMQLIRVDAWPRGRDLLFAPSLPAAIAAAAPDLVHVQSYHTLVAPVAMAAAAAGGWPSLLTFHSGGHSSGLRSSLRGVQLLALRPLLRRADALVAVSGFEARELARRLRLRRSRFTIVPNGAELPSPTAPLERDHDLVVSIGRLEAYKGHRLVVDSLPRLAERRPGVRLRIAGSGPDAAALHARAERLGVGDRVVIEPVPAGDGEAMARLLGTAGVVAVLSEYESQGIAAWEAVGAGAVVVVTDATALAELVERGLARGLRPGATPDEVALALDAALDAPRPEAIPAVPTWDDAADRLERLYERVRSRRAA